MSSPIEQHTDQPSSVVTIRMVLETLKELDPSTSVNDLTLFKGKADDRVAKPSSLENSGENDVTFVTAMVSKALAEQAAFAIAIAAPNVSLAQGSLAFIVSKPRLRFAQLCNALFRGNEQTLFPFKLVDTSKIHESARVSDHAFLGANVTIGAGTIISAGAIIHAGSIIGENCLVSPGVVIGGTGFGYEQLEGEVVAFPHYGYVSIGNNVEIGANTCIDRGSLQNTVIMDNVKIDNLVHVAHNATIKAGSLIIAGSVLCGSSVVGEGCWIAPNAVIGEGVSIGDNSLVGFSTVVKSDVPDNSVANGTPIKVYPRPTTET
jgi:UDP-3-O-[3-hydroxymyristoyl] glucosamine N-acyltransferase